MLSLDRRARAAIALLALAGSAPVYAQGDSSRAHEEHPAARHTVAAQQSHRAHPAHTQSVRTAPRWDASHPHEFAGASDHRETVPSGSAVRALHPAAPGLVHNSPAVGSFHVTRYGNTLSGTVERTVRPGFVSRTFVSGGHVLYTHVYQQHVWHQFGRAFAYDTFVPPVRYPAPYYAWALGVWPHPISYAWGWHAQPWYPMYGALFVPYPVYTSPDLWMTDYILAQSMQTAYQAQTAAPTAQPSLPAAPAAAPPDWNATPVAQPGDVAPAPQSGDAPPVAQPIDAESMLQTAGISYQPPAAPPAITPQIKAQLDAQIKVQLQDQQAAAATPVSLTTQTQSTPPALKPNHVFFQVVQRLEVPSGSGNHYCSLSADDYIKRTGGMSADDWTIPVVVELSGPSDCPAGLHTRIGLNDLNAMENEQEAQVMQAMQAASQSMGPNGPPSGPGMHPSLIADGSAAPDPGALDAIRQAQ
jgi:hypothetical protein